MTEKATSRYTPSTALVVVDVQNDFADADGSLAVTGGTGIIPIVNREVAAADAADAVVVFTQDWHPPDTPHFAKDGGIWPVHCVAGTWGAEFHPLLTTPPDAEVIRKGSNGEDGYSGFTMRDPVTGATTSTDLEPMLRGRGITDVFVVGLATDYCVLATALDAIENGFATTLLADAVAAVNLEPGDGARAVAKLAATGITVI